MWGSQSCWLPGISSTGTLHTPHSLTRHRGEHLANRLTRSGMPQIRNKLRQRFQYKTPVCHAGVWNRKVWRRNHSVSVEQNVDINGTGSLGQSGPTPKRNLQPLEASEELPGK